MTAQTGTWAIYGYFFSRASAWFFLKVDITKVWSDQLSSIECNYLPGGDGSPKASGEVFLMIGARADDKVHLKANATIEPNEPGVRSKVLFCLAKIDPAHPADLGAMTLEAGTSTVDAAGKVTLVSSGFSIDFHVFLAGIDENGDGQLSKDEVCLISDHRLRLVGQARYNSSLVIGTGIRDGFDALGFSQAADNMSEFLSPRIEGTYTPVEISANDDRLEHRVGLKLSSGCVDATAQEVVIGATSEGAMDVVYSYTLADHINSSLDTKRAEVAAFFADPANAGEESYIGSVAVAGTVDYGDHAALDAAAWLAFGKAVVDATCFFRVNRTTGKIDLASISGQQTDLYDWDYSIAGTDQPFACLQAGFPTLGDAGRVYKNRVELSHDVPTVIGHDMTP